MVKRQYIRAFVEEVAKQFQPERVILFGSYAYGKPTADSDVDLLVVMPHQGASARLAADIRKHIRAGFPLDLIVRSAEEVDQRIGMGDSFMDEIVNQGMSLYEAHHA
jgi:predicted nucleotidyltransferase